MVNNPLGLQLGQVIQAMTAEAGFAVKLQALESVSAIQAGESGDFDALLLGWPGYADPDINIYSLLYCKAPLNYSGYCNEEVDKLLDLARASDNLQERVKYYGQVQAIIAADMPHVFLYHFKWIWAHTARLHGFIATPDGLTRIVDLRLD